MATKTKPRELSSAEAEEALARAVAERDALKERVAGGDFAVTAAELAEADDAIALAELQIAGAAERERRLAEAARQARIAELRASMNDGTLKQMSADVVARFDAAKEAIGALWDAKVAYEERVGEAVSELRRLAKAGPMPDGVQAAPANSSTVWAVVDGVRWTWFKSRAAENLIGEAARDALRDRKGPQYDSDKMRLLRQIAGTYSSIDHHRRHFAAPEPEAVSDGVD
jgi:hypothetical protein